MKAQSLNPWTEEVWAEYPWMGDQVVESILQKSELAFSKWKTTSLEDRLKCYIKFASELRKNKAELAQLMAKEMGKILSEAEGEVEKCASTNERLAEVLPKWLQPEKNNNVEIHIHPLGPILGVMPWNFPLWQIVRFAVTTLASGNTVLIKPAPNVFASSRLLQKCYENSFPTNVVQFLEIDVPKSHEVLADPRVHGVSLTGSTRAGFDLSERAGKLMKKCVLELGGSDPYLIFEDADLEKAAKACMQGRFMNAGQSCVSAKRWIVHSKVEKQFTEMILAEMKSWTVGDPLDKATKMGPLARKDLQENLARQVDESVKLGAKVLTGGKKTKQGFGYEPTLIVNLKPNMPVLAEETFGPVATIEVCDNFEQMVKAANRTEYGLGAACFTRNTETAKKAFEQVQSGNFFVNDFVKSDALNPFGGVKHSGIGRELSRYGCLEFTNVRTLSYS